MGSRTNFTGQGKLELPKDYTYEGEFVDGVSEGEGRRVW